jgi:hypothetical protein
MKKKEASILIKQGRKTSSLKSPNHIKKSSGWAYLFRALFGNDETPIFLACKWSQPVGEDSFSFLGQLHEYAS